MSAVTLAPLAQLASPTPLAIAGAPMAPLAAASGNATPGNATPASAGKPPAFAKVLGQATREQAGAETVPASPAPTPPDASPERSADSPGDGARSAATERTDTPRDAPADAAVPADTTSEAAALQAWLASLPGAPPAPPAAAAAATALGDPRAATGRAVSNAADAAGEAAGSEPATGLATDPIGTLRAGRSAGTRFTSTAAEFQPAGAPIGAHLAKAASDAAAELRQIGIDIGSTEPVPLPPDAMPWLAAEASPAALTAALSGAATATGTATQPAVAAPTQAALSASPGSPQFAPQLGAQLSTFVRQGIEHASLHLNPADMGPVSVQIQLEGTAAQVRLWAEHPLTRQALEQAMPTLAGSLREAGLTLAGGGVFEQPPQPREPQERDSRSANRHADAAGAAGADDAELAERAATAAWLPRRRGVVDLLA